MTESTTTAVAPSALQVYERALGYERELSSESLWARDIDGNRQSLPISGWRSRSIAGDESVLTRCRGTTLDIGCGPGRLAAALARRNVPALGIDISEVAVTLARSIGAPAIRRSVFDPLPRTGQWHCVLLADGNIGIGGNPAALLRRVRELLRPGGAAYVEVGAPGSKSQTKWLSLEDPHRLAFHPVSVVRSGRARHRRPGAAGRSAVPRLLEHARPLVRRDPRAHALAEEQSGLGGDPRHLPVRLTRC